MKKDIEWLREQIKNEMNGWSGGNPDYFRGAEDAYEDVKDWLNQLDEPEVLSQEWVSDNAVVGQYPDGMGHVVPAYKLQNLLVPKQDVPVVPTWFDEWWKDVAKGEASLFHNIERFYDELWISGTGEMYSYIGSPDNKKKLLNIIINELNYEVEKEQKYVVELPNPNNQMGRHKNVFLNKEDGKVFIDSASLFVNDITKYGQFALTEEEIKKDFEWAWKFAKPVEELEQ